MGLCQAGLLLILALTSADICRAQTPSRAPSTPVSVRSAAPADETVLKFAEFLRQETHEHRDFLERYYTMTAAAFAGIAILFGSLLGWMNWRTKGEIKAQVEELYRVNAQRLVDEKTRQFDGYLSDTRRQFEQRVREINSFLLDLSVAPSAPKSAREVALKNRRVLWVDDYPENNAHPRRILEEAGMSFTTALSTEEALAALSHGSFDLIISDMGRGADATAGLTLLRELRQRGVRTPTIIYASSRGLQSHGATARELGAVAAVSGSALLLKQVAKVLGDEGDSSDDG